MHKPGHDKGWSWGRWITSRAWVFKGNKGEGQQGWYIQVWGTKKPAHLVHIGGRKGGHAGQALPEGGQVAQQDLHPGAGARGRLADVEVLLGKAVGQPADGQV